MASTESFGFLKPPYVFLLILSLAIGSIPLVIKITSLNYPTIMVWTSRLTVTGFGAYLTVVTIDYQIKKREKNELDRQRKLALHQLHSRLNNHLDNLCGWYIAANEQEDMEIPKSFQTLFEDDYISTVRYLDFSADCASKLDADDWYEDSHQFMSAYKNSVNEILERYGGFLDSKLLETLLKTSDNPLINPFSQTNFSQASVEFEPNEHNFLHGNNLDKALEMHLSAIQELMEYYEDEDIPDLEAIEDKPAWNQVNPGSARISVGLEETNPKFNVKNLQLDRFKLTE